MRRYAATARAGPPLASPRPHPAPASHKFRQLCPTMLRLCTLTHNIYIPFLKIFTTKLESDIKSNLFYKYILSEERLDHKFLLQILVQCKEGGGKDKVIPF